MESYFILGFVHGRTVRLGSLVETDRVLLWPVNKLDGNDVYSAASRRGEGKIVSMTDFQKGQSSGKYRNLGIE